MSDFYSECVPAAREEIFGKGPFNFEKIYGGFKEAVEKATEKIDGDIRLFMGKNDKKHPELIYNTNNKVYSDPNYPDRVWRTDIFPDALVDNGKPFSSATRGIVARISCAMAKNGHGYGENNPFHMLHEEIRN